MKKEKGNARLENGDHPLKASTCFPAFSSSQTSSLDHGQVNLKIYDQGQLFFLQVRLLGQAGLFYADSVSFMPTDTIQGYCLLNTLLLHRRQFGDSLSLFSALERYYPIFYYSCLSSKMQGNALKLGHCTKSQCSYCAENHVELTAVFMLLRL